MSPLIATTTVQSRRKTEAERYNLFECEYCALSFHTKDERKVHAMNHFRHKYCLDCNKMLIEICGDWYGLHSLENCNKENSSYNHMFDNDKEEITDQITFKQELNPTMECLEDDFPNEVLNTNPFLINYDAVDTSPFLLNFDAVSDLRNLLEISHEYTDTKPDVTKRLKAVDGGGDDDVQVEKSTQKRKKLLIKQMAENEATVKRAHTHRPKGKVTCAICDKVLCNFFVLQRHMADVHYPNASKIIAKQKRGKRGSYNTATLHRPKSKVICDICDKELSSFRYIQQHMADIHGPNGTKTKKKLNKIENRPCCNIARAHRPKSEVTCDICKKVFKRFDFVAKHIKNVHYPKEGRASCEICNRTYSSKNQLEVHMYTHKLVYPHICSVCGKGYVRLNQMLIHERVHTGIKPFACHVCGKKFYTDKSLASHMRMHSDERPFQCNVDECKWAFRHASVLKRHKARAHGIVKNKYPCPICGKEFPESPYHLKRHLQQAHKQYGPKILR